MASLSPAEVVRRWFDEVWNQRDPERIAAYFAPDAIAYSVDETGQDAHGPAEFRVFFERFLEGFSDIRFTLHDVMESGPFAAARWTAEVVHDGHGLGIAPTGRRVVLTGMVMARVEDGMIREGWNEWNRLGLATTLGLVVPA